MLFISICLIRLLYKKNMVNDFLTMEHFILVFSNHLKHWHVTDKKELYHQYKQPENREVSVFQYCVDLLNKCEVAINDEYLHGMPDFAGYTEDLYIHFKRMSLFYSLINHQDLLQKQSLMYKVQVDYFNYHYKKELLIKSEQCCSTHKIFDSMIVPLDVAYEFVRNIPITCRNKAPKGCYIQLIPIPEIRYEGDDLEYLALVGKF